MDQVHPAPHRPLVMGTQQAVSTGHYLATLAAMRILDRGGNAVDAGVAAGLCFGVLYPDMVSVAGVAPIIFYQADRQEVTTISGLGRWPRRASAEYFQEHCGGKIPHGLLRTVIPAAPMLGLPPWRGMAGCALAMSPRAAIALCEDGYPAHRLMCEIISEHAERICRVGQLHRHFSGARATAKRGRKVLSKGPRPHAPADGGCRTCQALSGRAAALNAAREEFYQGQIADTLIRYHETNGGLLTRQDLAEFRVQVEPPVSTRFHGYEVYACGPWCQGPVLPQVLNLLEGVDLAAMAHNSPEYLHLLVEALKLVYADRERYYGDPEFVDVPIDGLLPKPMPRSAPSRSTLKRPILRCPLTAIPGPIATYQAAGKRPTSHLIPPSTRVLSPSTPAICASLIGMVTSSPPPRATGHQVPRSSRGSASWPLRAGRNPGLIPGHASSVQPWKRPRLTPNPALVLKDGKPFMAFGTPGGDVQSQAMLQAFLNIVCFGFDPQQAVEAPRVASASFPNSFEPHAYHPGRLNVETSIPAAVRADMERKGHKLHLWPEREWRAGAVSAIVIDADAGVLKAAADPRRMNYALAW